MKDFLKDYYLYKITLTSACIVFSTISGIALAYWVYSCLLISGPSFEQTTQDIKSNAVGYIEHKEKRLNEDMTQLRGLQRRAQIEHHHDEWKPSLSECELRNEEYLDKIRMLGNEIFKLREDSITKLAQKQHYIDRLATAVANFKQNHYCVPESNVHFGLAMTFSLGTFYAIVTYYYRWFD